MKISVVYFSASGRTKQMAEEIKKGIEAVEGMEAVLIPVDSFEENKDSYIAALNESVGVLFGTPDYYASEAWQMIKGMLIYSGGTSLGTPFIHLGPVCFGPEMTGKELFPIFGTRFAEKAKELFGR